MNSKKNDLIMLFNYTSRKIENMLARQVAPFGLGLEQSGILFLLNTYKNNDFTIDDLANIMLKDKTTISRQISILEKKGLINKILKTNDKRIKFIKLTESGKEKIQQLKNKNIDNNNIESVFNTLDNNEKKKSREYSSQIVTST